MADGASGGGGGRGGGASSFDSAPNHHHCGVRGQTVCFNVKLMKGRPWRRMTSSCLICALQQKLPALFSSSLTFNRRLSHLKRCLRVSAPLQQTVFVLHLTMVGSGLLET